MTFGWPLALWGLSARRARAARLPARAAAARSATSCASRTSRCSRTSSPRRRGWRRHVPPALTLLALAALVVGVARPESPRPCRGRRRP